MTFDQIQQHIETYRAEGKKLFVTSSFQTHSIVLLHIVSRIDNRIPIFFINTGFLFPETVIFKDQIAKAFNLNIIDAKSSVPKSQQKDNFGQLLFASDPDYCCYLNKIQPLDPILAEYDVWINGVRADQTEVRKAMNIEELSKFGTVRFHPMLDWTKQDIYAYIREHKLPKHPLDEKGYLSIGCEPCTRKMVLGDERASRWFGLNKTECGLNTELVQKK
ncbi:MAG: phosphoadenylyl-sulfate reductase [Bacteroidales bacterium]|nr:phosphoadenylyl-sulfate reductase [Bacteroidales bacterium]